MKKTIFSLFSLLLTGLTIAPLSAAPTADTKGQNQSEKTAEPQWKCEEPVYEFGQVWSGEKVEHTFVFQNIGEAPLRILNVRAGCRCTAADDYDRVVQPGEKGKLPVTLNTKGFRHPITKTIRVSTNDADHRQVLLKIKGDVKPLVDIEPSVVNFGRINDQTELSQNVIITNNTEQTMNITPKEGKQDVFSWKMEELVPGKKVKLIVIANKPFRDGPNNTRIQLKTSLSQDPRIRLFCQLINPPLVECSPPVIWTRSKIEKAYTRSILVRFNGKGTMKLESATTDQPDIKTSIETVSQGNAYRVKITLPEELAIDPADPIQLVLKTDVEEKPQLEVPIKARPTRRRHARHRRNQSQELVGQQAPKVELNTPDNKKLIIGDDSDKIQLLNFWSPTCVHAQEELQGLDLLAAQLRKDKELASKVEFVNISLETLRPADAVVEKARQITSMPLVFDPEHQAAEKYKVKRAPTLFLVSPKGIVESVHQGYRFGMNEDLQQEIQLLAQGKSHESFENDSPRHGQYCPLVPPTRKQNQAGPVLTLETMQYFSGWIRPGEKESIQVFYRNDGNKPLKVEKVEGTNNVKVTDFTKTVNPGEVGRAQCQIIATPSIGVFSSRLEFRTNDHRRPRQLMRVMAMVKPLVTYMPPNGINFGRKSFSEPIVEQAALSYHGQGTIKYLDAECDSDRFSALVKTFDKSKQALLEVTAKPPFEQGMHKTLVRVKTDKPGMPPIKIPVRLYKPNPIEVIPKKLTVSKKSRPQRRLILITNNQDKPLDILNVKASSESIRPSISQSPDGESFRVSLTFEADFDCEGKEEKVFITTNNKQQSKIVVPIQMRSSRSG